MQLLIVDDEPVQRRMLKEYLAGRGHEIAEAGAVDEALHTLAERPAELVLTDVRLPASDGVELIRRARAAGCGAEFLVLTAFGTIENAVEAMRAGAYDYFTKPVRLDDLDAAIARLETARDAPPPAPAPPEDGDPFADLGPRMQEVRALADRVARSEATVLITGESGTGKEILADRLHARSRRARGPLVKVNCASLPDTLLEAELFGHAKGAFTGAEQAREGLFAAAAGGTLFLDEIGDISPALQARLLRVLQEREVLPLGTNTPVRVDCRVVAATHRDLDARVAAGEFREDLLYRLRVIALRVPPLRERPEDVPVLAERLLARHASRHGLPPKRLADDAVAALLQRPFPGNVRELEHALERAFILADGPAITAADLGAAPGSAAAPPRSLGEAVEALERSWIRRALAECGDVQAQAARRLGIPERVLRYKLRKYGMAPGRRK